MELQRKKERQRVLDTKIKAKQIKINSTNAKHYLFGVSPFLGISYLFYYVIVLRLKQVARLILCNSIIINF